MKNNVVNLNLKGLDQAKAFSDIFNRPNSSTFDPEFFQWQYNRSHKLFGGKDNGFYILKSEEHRILSYCAASNAPYRIMGRKELGRFFHEWFTDPTNSGVGLSLLTKQLEHYPILHVAGASIDTLNVFLRLRKSIWLQLDRLVAVLSPQQVSKTISSLDISGRRLISTFSEVDETASTQGSDEHVEVTSFDKTYDEVWKEVSSKFNLCVDRTSQYMNWRYLQHPLFDYFAWRLRTDNGFVFIVWRKEIEQINNIAIARICEVIGVPPAIKRATPMFLESLKKKGVVLADFFCSNGSVNDSLMVGGFHKNISLPEFDIPRLFSPLANDSRKTIHMALSFSDDTFQQGFRETSQSYFTKSDVNQDRPNP